MQKFMQANKRKYLKDLDKMNIKIDHQIVSSLRNPKTMSGLTSRNTNAHISPKNGIAGQKTRPKNDHSENTSLQYNISNDSVEGAAHSSTKTDTRKHSPMNVSAIIRESREFNMKNKVVHDNSASFSRNKMLKNKTLPNLFNYSSKAAGLNNSSTKAITKQFMNPNRKYYNSKKNKTFIEPKTPKDTHVAKNRVYESGSTTRSGGTGEPNYLELKRKVREKCMLSARGDSDTSSAVKNSLSKSHQNIYATKISMLTKENSQLRADYEK